jgi:acyl-CoA thioesterase-1
MQKIPTQSGADTARRGLRYGRRRVIVNATRCTAFAPFLASAQTSRRRLMILGDSITAGYGLPAHLAFPAKLQQALDSRGRAIEIVNAGVSGDTSAGGRARLDWALGNEPPPFAIVALGGNDALRGITPEVTEANLEAVVTTLKSRGTRVLLAGMLAPRNLGRDYAEKFDAIYPTIAKRHAIVLYPFFLEGVAADPALNQPDGIHPNPRGVEVMIERMIDSVLRWIDS